MSRNTFSFLATLVLGFALTTSTASAAPERTQALPAAATPLFGDYWHRFLDHWGTTLRKQNGIIYTALGVGAVSLFIITRGKWQK